MHETIEQLAKKNVAFLKDTGILSMMLRNEEALENPRLKIEDSHYPLSATCWFTFSTMYGKEVPILTKVDLFYKKDE